MVVTISFRVNIIIALSCLLVPITITICVIKLNIFYIVAKYNLTRQAEMWQKMLLQWKKQ